MFRLSASKEECLRVIYTLDPMGAGTRPEDIAMVLNAPKASVNHTLNQLEQAGLVERFGKGRAALTAAGHQQASEVKSRYETIRLYFLENLQVDHKTAAAEARKLEHSLSDESLAAMRHAVAQNDDWAELAELLTA